MSVVQILTASIDVSPVFATRVYNPVKMEHRELLQSISYYGVKRPLTVYAERPGTGRVTVLDGHIRLSIVRKLNDTEGRKHITTLPCIVQSSVAEATAVADELDKQQSEIVKPQVNINGSTAEALFREYYAAYEAVSETARTVQKLQPHGRDYQTVPNSVFEKAREQHDARVAKLLEVRQELVEIAGWLKDLQNGTANRMPRTTD